MVRRHRLALAVASLFALGLTVWACGGDDDDGGTGTGNDAGNDVITNPDTGGNDSGPRDSGGPDVITDAAADADALAPPPSTPGQITCGTINNCDAGEAICCYEFPEAGATTSCIPDTMACAGDQRPFDCDQKLDCAGGNNCCMDIGLPGDPDIGGASCAVMCGGQERALCKTNAECTGGTTCKFYNCAKARIGVCGTLPTGLCTAE